MRHSSELIGGFYHGALDSAREGISDLLENLFKWDREKDAQTELGEPK